MNKPDQVCWGDDDDVYNEACRLYFQRFGANADVPYRTRSEIIRHNYAVRKGGPVSTVILRNVDGVLAVFKWSRNRIRFSADATLLQPE